MRMVQPGEVMLIATGLEIFGGNQSTSPSDTDKVSGQQLDLVVDKICKPKHSQILSDTMAEWLRRQTRIKFILRLRSICWVRPHRFKSCSCRFYFFLFWVNLSDSINIDGLEIFF